MLFIKVYLGTKILFFIKSPTCYSKNILEKLDGMGLNLYISAVKQIGNVQKRY